MLLCISGASLFGNNLSSKEAIAKSFSEETKSKRQDRGINKAGEGIATAGFRNKRQDDKNKMDF